MIYVLRSKNASLPQFHPESVAAWNIVPDEQIAVAALWESIPDDTLQAVLDASPRLTDPVV